MKTRATRAKHRRREASKEANAVQEQLRRAFTPAVVDELRERTGYNPRQRQATAFRLMLTVIEGFLAGQTLSFASLRAIFVRRFGFVRPCPFQKRFKQASAAAFFRAALERLVSSVIAAAGLELSGPLGHFDDVRIYDGTGQRVPARGREALPACTKDKAGTKWMMGYSLKTGLLEHGLCDAETASETPLWKKLVPSFTRGVLYLFDLGFFERALFAAAKKAGAHVLMRLKSTAKVRVTAHIGENGRAPLPEWSLGYYLQFASRKRGTIFDLDVTWGQGDDAVDLAPRRLRAQVRLDPLVPHHRAAQRALASADHPSLSIALARRAALSRAEADGRPRSIVHRRSERHPGADLRRDARPRAGALRPNPSRARSRDPARATASARGAACDARVRARCRRCARIAGRRSLVDRRDRRWYRARRLRKGETMFTLQEAHRPQTRGDRCLSDRPWGRGCLGLPTRRELLRSCVDATVDAHH